ncbi:hypothetical protein LIP36_09845 [Amedibacillus dolichus]|uniref:hypothetical protein n=1 Tax=Amedibacillus dolichus TaxID=31971 RepID=UPI001D01B33D|nr:hypothetical protein [Amedibacillus dolichus]MCB5373903.1 hypothetical protein [Amedibacillus dolichus]
MMKFKERCDVCNKLTDEYDTSSGKLLCKECFDKVKNDVPKSENKVDQSETFLEKEQVVEEDKFSQTDIFDYLYRGM